MIEKVRLEAVSVLGTVFFCGAVVMVIELLGARVIAPFYGASLYVWSSQIAVTLIALAMGYFIGGHLADRAEGRGLSLIIMLAGLFTLLIPLISRSVLVSTDSLGIRLGSFLSALTLFLPSLACLGMVGPFSIRRLTTRFAEIGSSSGRIYAVSTAGSVLGTLLLGFFLFPAFGTRQILISTGVMLFVTGALLTRIDK